MRKICKKKKIKKKKEYRLALREIQSKAFGLIPAGDQRDLKTFCSYLNFKSYCCKLWWLDRIEKTYQCWWECETYEWKTRCGDGTSVDTNVTFLVEHGIDDMDYSICTLNVRTKDMDFFVVPFNEETWNKKWQMLTLLRTKRWM